MKWLIYPVAWLVTGYLLFLVSVKIDPQAAELIQKHEKTMVALIVLWPILVYGLLKHFYLKVKHNG